VTGKHSTVNHSTVNVAHPASGVLQLTFNRPERLNAVDNAFVADLHAVLDEVEADPSCRVVVLTGAGRGFCAGFDMKGGDYSGDPSDRPLADLMNGQRRLADLAVRIHELSAASVAAVNGAAAGAGFALALAADVRVASEHAVFIASNVKIGVSGGEMGMTWRLPRLIGEGRATELLLTGRRMAAAEALAVGLVTTVAPADQLLESALGVAGQIMATSPFSARMTKELLDSNASAGSLRHAVQNENRTQVLCNFTGHIAEAVAAFREGRAPDFG
jgi:enoyl-CoA hydratase